MSLASVPHVLGRARREGPAAVLTCLEDLRLWSAATTREQTLAAEAVADLIGGPFRLLGLESCAVRDGHLDVAVFRRRVAVTEEGPGWLGRQVERLLNPGRRFAVDFLLIPGGTFRMGPAPSGSGSSDDRPTVRIRPYLLARNPVIQRTWDLYGGEDQRRVRDPDLNRYPRRLYQLIRIKS